MRRDILHELINSFRDTLLRKTTFNTPQIETIIECLRTQLIDLSTPEEPPASYKEAFEKSERKSIEKLRQESPAFDNFVVNEMAKTPTNEKQDSFCGTFEKTANEKQVGGNHYKTTIQPWDFVLANNIGFLEGNAIKYIARHKQKNGIEDIDKAIHYLEKLKEHEASRSPHEENTIKDNNNGISSKS